MSMGCPNARQIEQSAALPTPESEIANHIRGCKRCRDIFESAKFENAFAAAIRAPRDAPPEIGVPEIAGYEIIREVSRGGQGIVFEAIQQRTRRRVAIKVLRQDHPVSPAVRARFEREIEIAAALKHPGIVAVYDSIALPQGRFALVLEFVSGQELNYAEPPGNETERRRRIGQITELCDAVHYAHQKGVIHRDLKPSNIIVDDNGRCRVLDFGIARRADDQDAGKITLTGEFTGTLAYASPEQVSGSGGPPDLRSDVYALGVLLYQASCGTLPYSVDGSLDSAIRNIAGADPVRPAGGIRVDEDLWTIIRKALAKESGRRYQSAGALADDLRRYLGGETIEARRDSRWYVVRKSLWKHRVGFGVLAGAVVGLAAFGLAENASNRRLREALRTSTIEKARAFGAADVRPQADALIWHELLGLGSELSDPLRGMFSGSPDVRRALWAYAEIQSAFPSIASVTLESRPVSVSCGPNECIAATENGWLHTWEMPGFVYAGAVRMFPSGTSGLIVSSASCAGSFLKDGRLNALNLADGRIYRSIPLDSVMILPRLAANGSVEVYWGDSGFVEAYEIPSLRRIFSEPARRQTPAVSATGDLVLYVSDDGRSRVRSLKTGEEIGSSPFAQIANVHPRFSDYGGPGSSISVLRNLIAIGVSRKFYVCDLDTGDNPRLVRITSGEIIAPEFTSSGRWIMVRSGSDPHVDFLSTHDWATVETLSGHEGGADIAGISDDERFVLTGDRNHVLRLWPGPIGGVRRELMDSIVQPHDIAFDSKSGELWASDSSGWVRAWDQSGRCKPGALRADSEYAVTIDRAARRGICVTGGADGLLTVFKDSDLTPIHSMRLEGGKIGHVRFSPDESLLAVAMRSGGVQLYRVEDWSLISATSLDLTRLIQIRWSPDGSKLAVAGGNGACAVIDGHTLQTVRVFDCHERNCRASEFSPDGRLLATTGDDGCVRFWDAGNWDLLREIKFGNPVGFALAFHKDGRVLAVGDRNGRLTMVDVENGRLLAGFDAKESIMALRFSGDQLAVACLDQPIRIWDFKVTADSLAGNREFWKQKLVAEPDSVK